MNDKEAPKRSPNFPVTPLEDCINGIKIIYEKDKLAATSAEVLVGHLGYNKLHGTSRRVLSSLKQLGLLDELPDQRYKVSEFGFKIINSDLNSPNGLELLKEAVLRPNMFRNVIEEYKGDLPSPQTLLSYLVLEKGFTPDGAQTFIKVLRENMEFANITLEDFTEKSNETSEIQGSSDMTAQQQQQNVQPPHPSVVSSNVTLQAFGLPTPDTKETVLNFKISRKSEARIIFYGEEVTQEAIEALRQILETQKIVYPTKAELEEERNQPKPAMWKNKDFDQPVKVTGELGELGGKKFYSVEGSSTGISEDEIEFEDES
jgi:hypothetical protein